ncbi:MAG: integrase core domain-containing protein, partial [Acidobacteriota bacterium]
MLRVIGALVVRALDRLRVLWSGLQERRAMAAEILFLRRQLALYEERGERPRRLRPVERFLLAALARSIAHWREALVVVRPETMIRWHREGFRLLWRWRSRKLGRPAVPDALRLLIAEMARDNPSWGEERIASELALKLGLFVSARTVRRCWPPELKPEGGRPRGDQRWATFVRNHAEVMVACDFLTCVTATFRVVYVFVVMEIGSRRILHTNVTSSPTADWTIQQLRMAIPCDHRWRFLIHDRDAIFSKRLDTTLSHTGLRVLRTPVRAPKANAFCERLVGTIRRELLDWLIPLSEGHLRRILGRWVKHYNLDLETQPQRRVLVGGAEADHIERARAHQDRAVRPVAGEQPELDGPRGIGRQGVVVLLAGDPAGGAVASHDREGRTGEDRQDIVSVPVMRHREVDPGIQHAVVERRQRQ